MNAEVPGGGRVVPGSAAEGGAGVVGARLRWWLRDLGLGARMALAGGRDGRVRAVLTALGVALGVVLMLGAASIPTMVSQHNERSTVRDIAYSYPPVDRAADTVIVAPVDTTFHRKHIHGLLVQAEGDRPVLPPGVTALPGPGQMVVSPALARLLAEPGNTLLRQRFDHPIVGTIGDAGLTGPNEYAYYLGTDQLTDDVTVISGEVTRVNHFGRSREGIPFPVALVLLIIVGVVVLLTPVAVFIAAAVRFGGDNRDRRLAAIRLVGADATMIGRIAAGEALCAAVLGTLLGGLVFLGVRQLVERVTLWNLSVFATDVRPSLPVLLLIVLGVPASAVVVSMAAMRRIVVEPLGVFRRVPRTHRRLWWRLVLPIIALVLLLPLAGQFDEDGTDPNRWRVGAGVLLLLFGMTLLLPWLIEAVVRKLGGGPVGWQLAVRRLQLDPAVSSRQINGVAVAAAGGIALLMLVSATAPIDSPAPAVSLVSSPPIVVTRAALPAGGLTAAALADRLRTAPGVREVNGYATIRTGWVGPNGTLDMIGLFTGDCAAVRALTSAKQCADGDVFLVRQPHADRTGRTALVPGGQVTMGKSAHPVLTVPADAHTVTFTHLPIITNVPPWGVFATPGAFDASGIAGRFINVSIWPDVRVPDYREQITTAAVHIDPLVSTYFSDMPPPPSRYVQVRRGLLVGTALVLMLIGASLLVGIVEQLRERRRLLAILVAYGTRRATLAASVLWQAAIPVVLGLVLAAGTGIGLGFLLLRMIGHQLRVPWGSVGLVCGAGGAVVLGVTALSLPVLWRLTRPDGLRTE